MTELTLIHDYGMLLAQDRPLLDVRAPIEFEQGAFPQAVNVPILNDEERHQIGKQYKEQGQDAAVELGAELVQGEIKEARIDDWVRFVEENPDGALYCFRGGMRSRIAQQWIHERTGINYPRIEGGYKALRRYLLEQLDEIVEQLDLVVVGGRTGVGKTRFILEFDNTIDLEGLANHTGSAFGNEVTAQPTQIDFENRIAIDLIKQKRQKHDWVIVEDEGKMIGSVHLPKVLHQKMQQSPLVILEASQEERVRITLDEYSRKRLQQFLAHYGEKQGFYAYEDYILSSLAKIRKRLGGERYKQMNGLAVTALDLHRDALELCELHIPWMRRLLFEYYDPMYDYQLKNKYGRLKYTGRSSDLMILLRQRSECLFE